MKALLRVLSFLFITLGILLIGYIRVKGIHLTEGEILITYYFEIIIAMVLVFLGHLLRRDWWQ